MNIWSDHWSMNSFRYVSLKRNTSQKYFTLKKNPQATFNFHIFFSFLSWKKPFSVKHIIAIKLASRAELDKNLKGGDSGGASKLSSSLWIFFPVQMLSSQLKGRHIYQKFIPSEFRYMTIPCICVKSFWTKIDNS